MVEKDIFAFDLVKSVDLIPYPGFNKEDLESMAKGEISQKKTVVSRKWIRKRLGMGEAFRLTQAGRLVNGNDAISLARLKKRLERIS